MAMRIYYFGELIEENGRKIVNETKTAEQTTLDFESASLSDEEPVRTGMPSIGDILKEIDLNLDVYNPFQKVLQ
jgi:hypothetical protein